MAIYAFDGTGNEEKESPGDNTNVLRFFRAYQTNYAGPGKCFYTSGVGTRWSFLGMFFGSVFGAGGNTRLKAALRACEENFRQGDRAIDIIGFSRGAALAREFANLIHDKGVNGDTGHRVRFLGLWDTVASFGLPGNNINLGHKLALPPNVDCCCHAMSLDERRRTFPLTRVSDNALRDVDARNIHEVWFRGYHSDVGGGNNNQPLSSIALVWMYRQARRCGVEIAQSDIDAQQAWNDSKAECKRPGMDRVENERRVLRETDLFHVSVDRREKADTFEANNPPDGAMVVDDEGRILDERF